MEGGRPSRRLATDTHTPAHDTSPTGLPTTSATPCHHQEEPEEVLLVPLNTERMETFLYYNALSNDLKKKQKKTKKKRLPAEICLKEQMLNERVD